VRQHPQRAVRTPSAALNSIVPSSTRPNRNIERSLT
jgi:hypothetical protein